MKLFDRKMEPVVCGSCGRSNLPGGVRCVYCGVHFPPTLDFEFSFDHASPSSEGNAPVNPTSAAQGGKQARFAGWLTSLGLLVLKGKSLLAFAKVGKVATTLFSMLVSIWFYAQIYQWPYAAGFVICILIHEMGHVFVNWRKGIPATAPMFIPFMGAVIFVKGFPDDPTSESESGAGGPIAGMLAAFVCLALWYVTRQTVFLALAHTGFFINLFNLMPLHPLDGSRIGSVFSPRMWNGVLVILLLIALKSNVHALWLIILMGIVLRLSGATGDPTRWVLAEPIARFQMAGVYLALCLILSIGADRTLVPRPLRSELRQGNSVQTQQTARSSAVTANRAAQANPPVPESTEQPTASSNRAANRERMLVHRLLIQIADGLGYLEIGLPVLLWFAISWWLSRASGARYSRRNLLLALGMISIGSIPFTLNLLSHSHTELVDGPGFWGERAIFLLRDPLYLGFLAATIGSAGFALLLVGAMKKTKARPVFQSGVAGSLKWGMYMALLVAYATNSLPLFGAVALLTAGFFAFNRWAWFGWCSDLCDNIGQHERIQGYLTRAIGASDDPLYRVLLARRLVNFQMKRDSGKDLLAAHDLLEQYRNEVLEIAKLEPHRFYPSQLGESRLIVLERRAIGYSLREQYGDVLTCCEQMLISTQEHTVSPLNLLVVRLRLARIALNQRWYDEALAQVEAGRAMLAEVPAEVQGTFLMMRALVHISAGDVEPALLDCDTCQTLLRDPYHIACLSAVRAQIKLKSGDLASAERQIKAALYGFPTNLHFLFLRAKIWQANGNEEGNALLRRLVQENPGEYWAKQAQEGLPA